MVSNAPRYPTGGQNDPRIRTRAVTCLNLVSDTMPPRNPNDNNDEDEEEEDEDEREPAVIREPDEDEFPS
jgi:hypothetical protein